MSGNNMPDDEKQPGESAPHENSEAHGESGNQQEQTNSCGGEKTGSGPRCHKHFFEDEFFSGARMTMESMTDAFRDAGRGFEDAFLSSVPPEVTHHLVNSKKEFLLAGQRAIDLAMERLDEAAARADDMQRQAEERKRSAGNQPDAPESGDKPEEPS